MILVSFADQDAVGSDQDDWANRYFGASDSVDDFYDEASDGQFGLAPAADTSGASNGVVRLDRAAVRPPEHRRREQHRDYVADAIEAADAVRRLRLVRHRRRRGDRHRRAARDRDRRGLRDGVLRPRQHLRRRAEHLGPPVGPRLRPASPLRSSTASTVGDSGYTTFGEWHCAATEVADPDGHMATIGIMAHEFGHDINWPDLYDVDRSSEGIGEFSLMARRLMGPVRRRRQPGRRLSVAPRRLGAVVPGLGHAHVRPDADQRRPGGGRHIGAALAQPGRGRLAVRRALGQGEYFLIENRQPVGYDVSTPGCGTRRLPDRRDGRPRATAPTPTRTTRWSRCLRPTVSTTCTTT